MPSAALFPKTSNHGLCMLLSDMAGFEKRGGWRKDLQCPCCLRHYASTIRLCRHLHHSAFCRRRLANQPDRVDPAPGQGSRKAPKEHLLCAPTLQALGPSQDQVNDDVDDELDRPSAEVLDCLGLLHLEELDLVSEQDEAWRVSVYPSPVSAFHSSDCV